MKLEEILKYLNQFGMSHQPTPWNEHYYVFWDADWNEYPVYGSDCVRWSFTEENGDVDKIYLTTYDSKYGHLNTDIKEITTIEDFYQTL